MNDNSNHGQYYEYTPITNGFIRLIQIIPCQDDDFGPIHIDLVMVSLQCPPQFNALSYTWGPSSTEEKEYQMAQTFTMVDLCYPVFFQGRILRVSKSLQDALRRIRQIDMSKAANITTKGRDATGQKHYIWADGICIDQSNPRERSSQVAQMGEVYVKAQVVLAYLGESDANTDLGIRAGIQLAEEALPILDKVVNGEFGEECFFDAAGSQILTEKQWREWFFRTWVIQEVCLGNEVVLICGSSLWSLSKTLAALTLIGQAQWGHDIIVMLNSSTDFRLKKYYDRASWWLAQIHPFAWVLQTRTQLQHGTRPSFSSAFTWIFRLTQCENPQDRIFGTMGLVAEFQDIGECDFPVSYEVGPETTFMKATKHILHKISCLDLLSINHRERSSTKLPSWCPDFGGGARPAILEQQDEQGLAWAATGFSTYDISQLTGCLSKLVVRGCCCDTIIGTVRLFEGPFKVGLIIEALKLLLDTLMAQRIHFRQAVDSFWKTFVFDDMRRDSNGKCKWRNAKSCTADDLSYIWTVMFSIACWEAEQNCEKFESEVRKMKHIFTQLLSFDKKAERMMPVFDFIFSEIEIRNNLKKGVSVLEDAKSGLGKRMIAVENEVVYHLPDADERFLRICRAMMTNTSKRAFFSTSSGRFGLGLDTITVGDQVWLLSGGKVPYVLHDRQPKGWQFIGEAYVDGIMHGEAWPDAGSELEDIILQ